MLPGARGAPGAKLAALTTPPELIDGTGWAHAPVRLAIRHAQPARRRAFDADMGLVRSLPHELWGRPSFFVACRVRARCADDKQRSSAPRRASGLDRKSTRLNSVT